MKQKDIALIIVIAFVAGIFAFIASNFFLASADNLSTEVETVPSISAEFPPPDEKYFNNKSENPTQLIRIQENDNQNPFPDAQ